MQQDVPGTDSAGQPWAGRHFQPSAAASDDGAADPALAAALAAFGRGEVGQEAVADAVRTARLLIPLVAHAGDTGEDEQGRLIDKTQELSIVTVAAPDGRAVLPAFTSVAAMSAWNPRARPVPADGARVALAAASEQTELVVLDPANDTEFVLRRPAVWAIGQGKHWRPSFDDPEVTAAFEASIGRELAVHRVALEPGDPSARLVGPELAVVLELAVGLTQEELDTVLARLAARWAADDVIATRVDSLAVRLRASA